MIRIGVLTPHEVPGPEPEFAAMASGRVATRVARVMGTAGAGGPVSPAELAALAVAPFPDRAAEQLLTGPADVIGYASTTSAYANRAGLSQAELAAQAGVTQSVISAYETGQRQPSLPALARLIEAAGFELTLAVRRQPARLRRLSGPVGRLVRRHRHDLVAAAAAHGVQNLRVFGSVARGEDRPGSDVDLLVDMPSGLSLFGLGRAEADLEAILGTRVELIPAADLKPGVRERIERDLIEL